MKQIIQYMRPYARGMCLGLFIKISATGAELLLPWILSYMIDEIIPVKSVRLIVLFGFVMLLCTLAACGLNIKANRMASLVARDAANRIRQDLFAKTVYLSGSQLDQVTLPSVIARLTTDTYNIHNMIGMAQRLGVRAPIMFLGGIAITLTLDPVLTLVMLSVLPFITVLVAYVYKKAMPMYRLLQKKTDRLVQVVREDTAGIRVIKALSKTDYEKKKFDGVNQDAAAQEQKAGMVMGMLNPVMNLFLNTGLVLVILAGAYRVQEGLTRPGRIIAFMSYMVLILNAVLFISRIFVMYSKASASAGRIAEILAMEEELKQEEKGTEQEPEQSLRHIEFDRVFFAYRGQKETLADISFSLKRGETLGIIGATGSGKTALINLLMRFYDVGRGAVKIDGRDIRSMEPGELRSRFGVVFQQDCLFNESIYENIRLGRELSQKEIETAIERAQAKEFIAGKKDGAKGTVNMKGTNLSGGQKQRVLVARALAAQPEILILDDSSSALDYKTDAALRKEIREHFTGTTTFLIAQRISSIMYADHILVLENGRMAGYGTHEELLLSCPVYEEISRSQSQGGDTDAETV